MPTALLSKANKGKIAHLFAVTSNFGRLLL
jgi:hypothetical protein